MRPLFDPAERALSRAYGICLGGAFPQMRVEIRAMVRHGVDGAPDWQARVSALQQAGVLLIVNKH